MADMMYFPNTIEEFIKSYSFTDSEEVYTNGSELVQVFRVEQALEHYNKEIRAKTIDEFVKAEDYLMNKIKEETADVNIDFEWRKVVCLDDIRRMLHQGLCEIAEQMKAGGMDE